MYHSSPKFKDTVLLVLRGIVLISSMYLCGSHYDQTSFVIYLCLSFTLSIGSGLVQGFSSPKPILNQKHLQPSWIGAWYIIADHGQLWWMGPSSRGSDILIYRFQKTNIPQNHAWYTKYKFRKHNQVNQVGYNIQYTIQYTNSNDNIPAF